jgi:hypothetical protein
MPTAYLEDRRWAMADIVMLAITVGFFALAFVFAVAMDRV